MAAFPEIRQARRSLALSRVFGSLRLSQTLRVLLVSALLLGSWGLTYNIGGARIIGTHSFYIPLLLSAYWFGSMGAVLAGLAGAILAGPLLPLDTTTGAAQMQVTWLSRALAFQVIGQTVAWFLARPRGEAVLEKTRQVVATVNSRLMQDPPREQQHREALERVRGLIEDPTPVHVVFQPLVDLKTGGAFAMEALSRFSLEPRRPPDKWFEEAWTVGLGIELELTAMERAISYMGRLPEGSRLAVNVSPDTVISTEFADVAGSLPVEKLVLELTEHSRIDEYPAVTEALREFRADGGMLAIDDTGAGYATFRHVLELLPDIIKLDVELTRRVESDVALRALTQSMVRLGLELDAMIVAEGVETAEQLDALRDLGVRYAQGFFLSKPAPIRIPEAGTANVLGFPESRTAS